MQVARLFLKEPLWIGARLSAVSVPWSLTRTL